MKKYISVITVLFVLSFVLIACSNSNDSASEDTNNNNVSEEDNSESSNDDNVSEEDNSENSSDENVPEESNSEKSSDENSNESSENRKDSLIDHDTYEDPMHLVFSSGAGAWRTEIKLASDGSFTGKYEDANAGMSEDGYLSTNYISEFTGLFDEIERPDEETYSMKLLDINYEHEEGEEWIEDNIKYIATEAYGFEEGEDFFLYSPKKNIGDLNEDLLSWRGGHVSNSSSSKELQHWVLHNKKTNYGFYSEQYLDDPENESESNSEEETVANSTNTLPLSFEHIEFDSNYSGPGSEFIGTWHQVNHTTVDFAPNPWEINYKDGTFYISAELPGDPATIIMTAEYKDEALHSNNGTLIELLDYQNPDTLDIELPETIEVGGDTSRFFFENGYLQWDSEQSGDLRDFAGPDGGFEGYEKK